jgi:hypothetical protein
MRLNGSSRRIALVVIVLCGLTVSVTSAPLPISVTASASQAAAGNSGEASILVYLANADGSPKVGAQIPGQDPNGGVELKNSKWAFQTLEVPQGYRQQFRAIVAGQPGLVELGELRIMAISVEGEGLYRLHMLPAAGLKGGKKVLTKWVSGEYLFRVSYKDANDRGTAIGALTIR